MEIMAINKMESREISSRDFSYLVLGMLHGAFSSAVSIGLLSWVADQAP